MKYDETASPRLGSLSKAEREIKIIISGGRIAVYYDTNDFTGTMEAHGGMYNLAGEEGTIHLESI